VLLWALSTTNKKNGKQQINIIFFEVIKRTSNRNDKNNKRIKKKLPVFSMKHQNMRSQQKKIACNGIHLHPLKFFLMEEKHHHNLHQSYEVNFLGKCTTQIHSERSCFGEMKTKIQIFKNKNKNSSLSNKKLNLSNWNFKSLKDTHSWRFLPSLN
jgi:hypothetical protein